MLPNEGWRFQARLIWFESACRRIIRDNERQLRTQARRKLPVFVMLLTM